MHYGIVTCGSRGDVQPFIALALELKRRGHRVGLLGNENFAAFVAGYGIEFYPLPVNTEEMLQTPEFAGLLKSGNVIAYLRELRKITRREQDRILEGMLSQSEKFEVLVATPLTMVWVFSLAERLNKRWAIIQLSVPAEPTRLFPFLALDFINMPFYNSCTYAVIRWLFWQMNKRDIQAQREFLKLPPLKTSLLGMISERKIPHLYAFSPSLIKRPDDWSHEVDIIGFLNLPLSEYKETGENLSDKELRDWIEQGTPPIYIGFGSIPVPDPDILFKVITYLLQNTGERYVFCSGWSSVVTLPKQERIFRIQSVNHEWLFPQCTLAIIHGGIGTIGAVLRAKIPMIVVSIFGDQPVWGKFIAKKGIGVHVPFRKITGPKLVKAMAQSGRENIRRRARELGDQIRGENGVNTAITKFELYFQ